MLDHHWPSKHPRGPPSTFAYHRGTFSTHACAPVDLHGMTGTHRRASACAVGIRCPGWIANGVPTCTDLP
eukprot:8675485-Alexandrium_andersonii.AAC.1